MATNQGDRQASVRAATGTASTYEGDWHALFDQAGIAAGTFNGRLLAWINSQLGSSYTELNGAMSAYAAAQGASSWNEMGTFSAGLPNPGAGFAYLIDSSGNYLVDSNGAYLIGAA